VEKASKPIVESEATDADVLDMLILLDELEAQDTRHAKLYEATRIRKAALSAPGVYPNAYARQRAPVAAAEAAERERHAQAKQERIDANLDRVAQKLPMVTTPTIARREITAALTVISGSCVMSRNVFSVSAVRSEGSRRP
jgi:hypothetical protein